jgi:hypothetical protein
VTSRAFALALIASVLSACSGPGTGASPAPFAAGALTRGTIKPGDKGSPPPTGPISGVPATIAIPAAGATYSVTATGENLSAMSSNKNIFTVRSTAGDCPAAKRHPMSKPLAVSDSCLVLTGVAAGPATLTVNDDLGNSVVASVLVQTPILVSIPAMVALQQPGDTLTFTAGVDAPNVPLAATSNLPGDVSVAPAANAVRAGRFTSREARMTTNVRFTIAAVEAPKGAYITVSSTNPNYSPATIYVETEGYLLQWAPITLDLNLGESVNVLPWSPSFDDVVSRVDVAYTDGYTSGVTVANPYPNSPIFTVTGNATTSGTITAVTSRGTSLTGGLIVQPISATPYNLAFTTAGQKLQFTVREAANVAFTATTYDSTTATVAAGTASRGATSSATFNATAVAPGQTVFFIEDGLGRQATVDVIVGKPLSTTPASLSLTAIGQTRTFAINYPPAAAVANMNGWFASAASSDDSVAKVAFNFNSWTVMAVKPGKATIYVRNTIGTGIGLGEMISIPVDVTATGGVIH